MRGCWPAVQSMSMKLGLSQYMLHASVIARCAAATSSSVNYCAALCMLLCIAANVVHEIRLYFPYPYAFMTGIPVLSLRIGRLQSVCLLLICQSASRRTVALHCDLYVTSRP